MRGLRSTLVLLVVLAALGAYIYFVESKRDPTASLPERVRIFDVDASKIVALDLVSSTGERTTLEKRDAGWRVTAPADLAADEAEVSAITSNLATVDVEREVDPNPADLAQFGLETPRIVVGFRVEGSGTVERLEIGEKTATGGDLYAKTGSSPRVFLISGFLDTTFDRETFDLRDKAILVFDRTAVTSAEVVSADHAVTFTRAGESWRLSVPFDAKADYSAVEALLGRLGSAQMKAIVDEAPADLTKYGLARPSVTVTLSAGSARAALLVGDRTPDNLVYAKDASRAMVFTVDSFVVEDLRKAPNDFRPKDVFEFRSFTGTRFEVLRGGTRTVFEKGRAGDDEATERWRQVQPDVEVETAKIDDFLSRISNLRAESFVAALPGDATEIVRAIAVSRDGSVEEVVNFFRSGDVTFVVRPDEPGAAVVSTAGVDGALSALDEMKS